MGWSVSRPDDAPDLILIEADYVALNDEQAAAFVAAINEAREGKADLQWGETTY